MGKNTALAGKLHRELRKIAEYRALWIAKCFLLLSLVILYFPMRPMPAYFIIFSIGLPLFLRISLFSADKQKKDAVYSFALLPTAKEHHFTMQKYRCEKTSGNLVLFLILLWQYSVVRYDYYEPPLTYAPAAVAIAYLLIRLAAKYIYFFYLHHNFMALRLENEEEE